MSTSPIKPRTSIDATGNLKDLHLEAREKRASLPVRPGSISHGPSRLPAGPRIVTFRDLGQRDAARSASLAAQISVPAPAPVKNSGSGPRIYTFRDLRERDAATPPPVAPLPVSAPAPLGARSRSNPGPHIVTMKDLQQRDATQQRPPIASSLSTPISMTRRNTVDGPRIVTFRDINARDEAIRAGQIARQQREMQEAANNTYLENRISALPSKKH